MEAGGRRWAVSGAGLEERKETPAAAGRRGRRASGADGLGSLAVKLETAT